MRLVDGSSGIDIYTADVKFNNAIETFKSPKVINTIGYKLLLHDLTNPAKAYRVLSKNQKGSDIFKAVPEGCDLQSAHSWRSRLHTSRGRLCQTPAPADVGIST